MVEMITYDPEIFNETWNKISNVTEKRMKKYRVETRRLVGLSEHDIVECRNGLCECMGSGYTFDEGIIDRNPEWFTPVEEEFQEGDWVVTKSEILFKITHIDDETYGGYGFDIIDGRCWFDEDYNVSLLRHIERKATKDEIESALIAEAKRRGLIGSKIKSANPEHHYLGSWKCPDGEIEYHADVDGLTDENGWIYYQGKFAEIVDEPIQINGHEVDTTIRLNNAGESVINIGCSHPPVYLIENLNQAIDDYDLAIYREGENITSKIQKIAERL